MGRRRKPAPSATDRDIERIIKQCADLAEEDFRQDYGLPSYRVYNQGIIDFDGEDEYSCGDWHDDSVAYVSWEDIYYVDDSINAIDTNQKK